MRQPSSHKLGWFAFRAKLPLIVLVLLCVATARSLAQRSQQPGNRQLERDAAQQQKQTSERRLALVIGNGGYQNGKLKNPPNDATAVTGVLRELGFEVTSGIDKSQHEMKQMIREFGQRLRANGGVGLFYFAGHGVQAKGRNYLIPVDADIQAEADLEDQAVDVNYLLRFLDDAENALNIVILDACRNNPFTRSFRSAQEGLAQVRAPTGTLIAYATAPDSAAADGVGANSPYTQELMKQLRVSGVLVETVFRRVTEQVSSRTNGKQEPWFSANVKGDFYFSGGGVAAHINDADDEFWQSIKTSADPEDYKAYLNAFPTGRYAVIAQNALRRVQSVRPLGNISLKEESESSNSAGQPSDDATSHFEVGLALAKNRKWKEAEPEYRLAIAANPNRAEWHNRLSDTLIGLKKYEEAEAEARKAILLDPRLADSHYRLGVALSWQNKWTECETEYREAVRLDPSIAEYHRVLGVLISGEKKKASESERELREAIRLNPTATIATFRVSLDGHWRASGTMYVSTTGIEFTDADKPQNNRSLSCSEIAEVRHSGSDVWIKLKNKKSLGFRPKNAVELAQVIKTSCGLQSK